MKLPDIQKLTQKKAKNPYASKEPAARKTVLLMFGGVFALLGILAYLVFGTGGTPAGNDMKLAVEDTADVVAALNSYSKDLQFADSKNTAALANSLLEGDFKALNDLYGKTYGDKKKLPATPKLSSEDKSLLDDARNSNKIDSGLFDYIRPKLLTARIELVKAKVDFTKTESLDIINRALTNLETISTLLSQPGAVAAAR